MPMTLANLLTLWNDLFEDVVLPEQIDKDTCINAIIDKCENHIMLYIDYPFVKNKITRFFQKNYQQYQRIVEVIMLEYGLLENYDRTREYTRKVKRQSNGTDTNKVSAFNSDDFTNDSQNINSAMGNDDEEIKEREYGDLSVISTTKRVEEEIALRKHANIYEIIAGDFYDNFMVRYI